MKSQLTLRRFWRAAAIPLVVGIALLAASCGRAGPGGGSSTATRGADSPIVIRGVVANTSDPFWTSVACGATKEAKKRGIDFKWYASKSTDATELNSNFDAALLDKPQGVILDSPTVQQFAARVAGQQAKGVPFSVAVGMTPPAWNTIVGNQDAPPEVIAMGKEVLKDGGSVFTVGGSAAVPIVADRYRLLLKELGTVNGVRILPVQFTDFDPAKTQVSVNSAILANPDLKLIVASTGPETIGALAALRQAGRADIKIISVDAVPPAVEALRAGKILTIMSTPVEEFGRLQLSNVADYIEKHKGSTDPITSPQNTTIKIGYLTQQNLDDPKSQGFIYKATCDA